MSKKNRQGNPWAISQNFLTSRRVIEGLIDKAGLTKTDVVLEIGAGRGHITKRLAEHCRRVLAYEIDPVLCERLAPQLSENVHLIHADFLRCPLPDGAYKVFANIPFSRTTEILRKLTNGVPPPQEMYLVLEEGAARRFCGSPRENLNSLLLRPFFETAILHRFDREDFHPAPRVDTVLLALRCKQMPDIAPQHRAQYQAFLRHCFRYGLHGGRALLTKKQISTALRLEGLPPLAPTGEVLYVQWLCLFRCWQRYGKRIPEIPGNDCGSGKKVL